jgi:L-alanine-DL-glutamate epimerase-like enolase superfamily enzyme
MKITALETVRIEEFSNLLWVLVHTDQGVSGLGETAMFPAPVESYVHEHLAAQVIGRDPRQIDGLAADLQTYVGFASASAEVRATSAFDIALWDVFGKLTQQPVAQLLGGFTRRAIRTYNTCAGSHYMRKATTQSTSNWGLEASSGSTGLNDLDAFLNRADELALSLLEEGITAMKIWPFDIAAEKSKGWSIGTEDLKSALQPFEKIRRAVGDRMDIMVEFHSLWQLMPAIDIARALAPYRTFWHEDPIRMDALDDLRRYARESRAPVCASETLATRFRFRDLLATEAAGVVMLDVGWCGGLSEAKKIATMAEAWKLPVAPHDCTGPIGLIAGTHLSLNAPNALIQESVRAYYRTWYRDIVTELPTVSNGMISVSDAPGLGTELHPELDKRFTVHRRTSR